MMKYLVSTLPHDPYVHYKIAEKQVSVKLKPIVGCENTMSYSCKKKLQLT